MNASRLGKALLLLLCLLWHGAAPLVSHAAVSSDITTIGKHSETRSSSWTPRSGEVSDALRPPSRHPARPDDDRRVRQATWLTRDRSALPACRHVLHQPLVPVRYVLRQRWRQHSGDTADLPALLG